MRWSLLLVHGQDDKDCHKLQMFFLILIQLLGHFFLYFIAGGIHAVKRRCLTDGFKLDVLY